MLFSVPVPVVRVEDRPAAPVEPGVLAFDLEPGALLVALEPGALLVDLEPGALAVVRERPALVAGLAPVAEAAKERLFCCVATWVGNALPNSACETLAALLTTGG